MFKTCWEIRYKKVKILYAFLICRRRWWWQRWYFRRWWRWRWRRRRRRTLRKKRKVVRKLFFYSIILLDSQKESFFYSWSPFCLAIFIPYRIYCYLDQIDRARVLVIFVIVIHAAKILFLAKWQLACKIRIFLVLVLWNGIIIFTFHHCCMKWYFLNRHRSICQSSNSRSKSSPSK